MKLTADTQNIIKISKRGILTLLLGLVFLSLTTVTGAKTLVHSIDTTVKNISRSNTAVEPSVTFEKAWVDYDVMEKGVEGMTIHAKFKVYQLKGIASWLKVRFMRTDESFLLDKNGKYYDTTDKEKIAVFRKITPRFDVTDYEDLSVFMPYGELDLSDGKYNLKMDIDLVYDDGGELIQHMSFYDFEYSQGNANTKKAAAATFKKMWVDYDVTEEGQKGMRIHVSFGVTGMKGVDAYLAIYFQKKNGTKLYTSNKAYRSKDGQTAVYWDFKPGYDPAEYEDVDVFIPYSEFNLSRGKYDLQMDADIIYKNGDIVQHLELYDFVYSKG